MAETAAREIEESVLVECERAGRQFKVSGDIHPEDFIFWFILDHPSFPTKAEAVDYYFAVGRESAQKVRTLIQEFSGAPSNPVLLEFASGFGCVTRHMQNEFPEARVVACDIHNEALDFIFTSLKTPILRSAHIPEDFESTESFDVIFAISFFSHIPASTWQRWLQVLADRLSSGGLLIFTTHGLASLPVCGSPALDGDGYWFIPSSEQKDLAGDEYGSTITTFPWVYRQLEKTIGVRLLRYQEAFWFGHQDLYVLRRV